MQTRIQSMIETGATLAIGVIALLSQIAIFSAIWNQCVNWNKYSDWRVVYRYQYFALILCAQSIQLVAQMTAPPPQNSASVLIDTHHEANAEPPRPHMGCSLLGHPCDRYLWLSFRWASQEQFSGRMLRLFRRGQEQNRLLFLICAQLA